MHYSKIIFTNLPSFYKINLYNQINLKSKLFVIFTGDTAGMRNKDFFQGNMDFDFISLENLTVIGKLNTVFKTIKKHTYEQLIICGVNELTSWLCLYISPKSKNATVVESSYHEATLTGLRGFMKRIFFNRISITYASGKAQEKLALLHHFKGKIIITKGVGIFNIVEQPIYTPAVKVTDFIYVGRLSPEKNLILLIGTFNQLPHLILHIVGYGSQESELKLLANDNIVFHGAVENKKLPELYKSADVFILPSIKEPWGLVVEEALNNGLPVLVSSHVGCAEEIIREDYNGLIFEYDNINSLLSKIEKITEINYYNKLKFNISRMNFNEIANYQANCYL
jgi:glycosyltransferase involved in cell wall biosynthesis